VSVSKPYTWAQKMFNDVLPRFGVTTTYVDGTDTKNFESAITENTTLIYLETPNSWTYELQDLAAIATLAKKNNIVTICDNSYCTPLYQRPIEFGIDLSLQSATKYIGGHSDVVAGVLSGSRKMIAKIFNSEFMNMGLQISPFDAWLLTRGLRTLPVRLQKISDTTTKMVSWLKRHPKVEEVLFPMDPEGRQYELAKKQMTGACGLVTVVMKADTIEEINKFCESLQHILMAVSWGGYESLALPGCAIVPPKDFDKNNRAHRMIRFYFGLEEPEYLINDIAQAFAGI
jgi:cystathionine beta-lyase/cystathionine gamma-synthase